MRNRKDVIKSLGKPRMSQKQRDELLLEVLLDLRYLMGRDLVFASHKKGIEPEGSFGFSHLFSDEGKGHMTELSKEDKQSAEGLKQRYPYDYGLSREE